MDANDILKLMTVRRTNGLGKCVEIGYANELGEYVYTEHPVDMSLSEELVDVESYFPAHSEPGIVDFPVSDISFENMISYESIRPRPLDELKLDIKNYRQWLQDELSYLCEEFDVDDPRVEYCMGVLDRLEEVFGEVLSE